MLKITCIPSSQSKMDIGQVKASNIIMKMITCILGLPPYSTNRVGQDTSIEVGQNLNDRGEESSLKHSPPRDYDSEPRGGKAYPKGKISMDRSANRARLASWKAERLSGRDNPFSEYLPASRLIRDDRPSPPPSLHTARRTQVDRIIYEDFA